MINSTIYKITCKDINILDCYIGRTTNFRLRHNMHKYSCCNSNNKLYNMKLYIHIRKNGDWCNWDMTIVETFEHTNKIEADTKEAYYIKSLNGNLNSCTPGQTDKEYYSINKEILNKKAKEYYNIHKEKVKEKAKIYNSTNKENQKEYYSTNKEIIIKKSKEYYNANKETIKEKAKEYYQTIKEKKKEYYINNKMKKERLNIII